MECKEGSYFRRGICPTGIRTQLLGSQSPALLILLFIYKMDIESRLRESHLYIRKCIYSNGFGVYLPTRIINIYIIYTHTYLYMDISWPLAMLFRKPSPRWLYVVMIGWGPVNHHLQSDRHWPASVKHLRPEGMSVNVLNGVWHFSRRPRQNGEMDRWCRWWFLKLQKLVIIAYFQLKPCSERHKYFQKLETTWLYLCFECKLALSYTGNFLKKTKNKNKKTNKKLKKKIVLVW